MTKQFERRIINLPRVCTDLQLVLFKFIVWLAPWAGKMNQILRCDWLPEREGWSYLARSGLSAVSRKKYFPESQIRNPLLTKFVRSRWMNIGLVRFLRVYGHPQKTRKKRTWPISSHLSDLTLDQQLIYNIHVLLFEMKFFFQRWSHTGNGERNKQ